VFLWALVCATTLVVVTAWLISGGALPMAWVLFGILLVVHFTLAVWMASEACHLFAGARDSGALELLACTPLKVKELIDGHLRGLKLMVHRPLVFLVSVEGALLLAQVCVLGARGKLDGFLGVGVVVLYLTSALLDLVAVAHFGLWQGLANRKPTKALNRTLLYVLLLPLLGSCFPLIGILKNLILANYAREQMRRHFRSLLTERYAWSEESEFVGRPSQRALAHQLPRVIP
jgi:hypothetical protein